jgi:hypothetical protein
MPHGVRGHAGKSLPAIHRRAREKLVLDGSQPPGELRPAYEQWAKETGLEPVTHVEFTQAMRELQPSFAPSEHRANTRRSKRGGVFMPGSSVDPLRRSSGSRARNAVSPAPRSAWTSDRRRHRLECVLEPNARSGLKPLRHRRICANSRLIRALFGTSARVCCWPRPGKRADSSANHRDRSRACFYIPGSGRSRRASGRPHRREHVDPTGFDG